MLISTNTTVNVMVSGLKHVKSSVEVWWKMEVEDGYGQFDSSPSMFSTRVALE